MFASLASASAEMSVEPLIWRDLVGLFGPIVERVRSWISAGYDHAPLLMLTLATVLVVPILAALGWLLVPRSLRFGPGVHTPVPSKLPSTLMLRVRSLAKTAQTTPMTNSIVRIGSHADNDVTLQGASVAEFHALVHPTGDGRFIIVDLTDPLDMSVCVNGEAVTQSELRAGDTITVGEHTLYLVAEDAKRDDDLTTQIFETDTKDQSEGDENDRRKSDAGRSARGRKIPGIAA